LSVTIEGNRACRRLTAAQRKCPASFARRVLSAYAEDQFAVRDSRTLSGHDPQCRFVRGGSCDCVPDITLRLPDGSLVDVDQAGRVTAQTHQ
jgi:hypothetical protein